MSWRQGLWLLLAGWLQAASLAWPVGNLPGLTHGSPSGLLQVVALASFFYILKPASTRQVFVRSWFFATAWLSSTFWWLFISMHRYGGLDAWLAALAVLALAAALGLYYALSLSAARRWVGAFDRIPSAVALASAWTLAELMRGQWFTGFPWGAVGYAHVDSPLGTLAPWVGVYGLGAVAAYLAAWLALGWGQWAAPRLHRTPVMVCLALVGLPWLAHSLSWSQWGQSTKPISVDLLQGQIAQDEKFHPGRGVDTALTWYASAAKNSTAQLIVAPETAWPVLPHQLPAQYLSEAIGGLKNTGSAWLVGLPLGDLDAGYTNSAVALTGESSAAWSTAPYRYDKHHLVPFGEFTPPAFRWFTRLMHIPLGDFERGALGQAPFEHASQRIAPNICYEDLFGEELAMAFVDQTRAPTLMVNMSNIGWFGQSIAIEQHLQISRMRTLEMQRPMLRATNTGATAVVDADGVVLARLDASVRGVLHGSVRGRSGATTVYSRWVAVFGLWPMWALALVFLWIAAYNRKSQI